MNELALFAGAGGGILGGHLLLWRTVCAVEWEPYPASVLCARQNDGFLPPFPVWDDVQTFDGKPWRGIVDVVSGGFPCQDISAAGKGEGIDGERSGMWREMARIIHEVRPKFVFVENSPMLTSRGLGRVLGDLASMGFDARWGVLGAADVGANHQRDRIWIRANLPNSNSINDAMRGNSQNYEKSMGSGEDEFRGSISHSGSGCERSTGEGSKMADTKRLGWPKGAEERTTSSNKKGTGDIGYCGNKRTKTSWWAIEPNVGRVADGVASRVDRLKAIGNGQVSEVARRAWEVLGDL
jgi:DNA (cytosine-5)-methyltransferase 1